MSIDSITGFVRNKYPEGVFLGKTPPYWVGKDSESYYILKSLLTYNDLSEVPVKFCGEFHWKVLGYTQNFESPFEAFVCAFFEEYPHVYLPAKFSSMETAAWSIAELVYNYHAWCLGIDRRVSTPKSVYNVAMTRIEMFWSAYKDQYEAIVRAFWKVQGYT